MIDALAVRRTRNTLANYERIIRAAAKQGRVAASANHYPDGRVEFIFTDPTNKQVKSANDWD